MVANARTLEQKISDAGPGGQRLDPHVFGAVRAQMEKEGVVQRANEGGNVWFYLGNTPSDQVQKKLAILVDLFAQFSEKKFLIRLGQTLEIATYRAMREVDGLEFYGRFRDLDSHDDATAYSKEEPPGHIGTREIPGGKLLDFLVRHPDVGHLGIECKNVREWLYPNRLEVKDLLFKATALDCVPVLIARRIPFVTFKLLSTCGVIVHQTYNQLLPSANAELAAYMQDKELFGYHDIRIGNAPDTRLKTFIGNMMAVAPAARERFDDFKDILGAFGTGEIKYPEFAARIRRRSNGTKEDNDWPDDEEREH